MLIKVPTHRRRNRRRGSIRNEPIRRGLVQSLHPLHERHSWIIPEFFDRQLEQQQHCDGEDNGDNEEYRHRSKLSLFGNKTRSASGVSRLFARSTRALPAMLPSPPDQRNPLSGQSSYRRPMSLYASTLAVAPPLFSTAGGGGPSLFKYLLAFTAGGLFFSTALAGAYAFYGLGVDNMKRILAVLLLVWGRIWTSFSAGLSLARMALMEEFDEEREDRGPDSSAATPALGSTAIQQETPGTTESLSAKKKWKWVFAWNVLKQQLSETRRTAAEGVQALQQEATLYTAVLGQPALIPVQYAIQKLMPYSLTTILEGALRDSLDTAKSSSKSIKKLTLSSFTAGARAPLLTGARIYDVEDAIAFDCDVQWKSQVEATVQLYTVGGLARVPVSIKDVGFEGVVRIILTPLTKQPPGYGAMLLSLPTPPRVSLDVKILGGEVTKLPFLRTEITSIFQKAITDQLLWPRRNVIPTMDGRSAILDRQELLQLKSQDPLLEAEQNLVNADQPSIMREIREEILQSSPKDPIQIALRIMGDAANNTTSGTDFSTKDGNRLKGLKRFDAFQWGSKIKHEMQMAGSVVPVKKALVTGNELNATQFNLVDDTTKSTATDTLQGAKKDWHAHLGFGTAWGKLQKIFQRTEDDLTKGASEQEA